MSDVRARKQAFDDAHQTVRALIADHVVTAADARAVEDAVQQMHLAGCDWAAAIVVDGIRRERAAVQLAETMTERPDPTPATREFVHAMAEQFDTTDENKESP